MLAGSRTKEIIDESLVKIGKFLNLVLCHRPGKIGLNDVLAEVEIKKLQGVSSRREQWTFLGLQRQMQCMQAWELSLTCLWASSAAYFDGL